MGEKFEKKRRDVEGGGLVDPSRPSPRIMCGLRPRRRSSNSRASGKLAGIEFVNPADDPRKK